MSSAPPRGGRTVLQLVFSRVNVLATALLGIGGFGAVWGWKPGAYVMIAALGVTVLAHVVVGVFGYRETMSHPWPHVRPLGDEDDW